MADLVASCAKLSGAMAIFLSTAVAAVAQSSATVSLETPSPATANPATVSPDTPSQAAHKQPAPDIPALVRELGADDYRQRNAAELRLAEIGRPAREALAVAVAGGDAETRLRARELLKRIRIDELWEATTFRYDEKSSAASAAVRALSKQTGNRVLLGDQYGSFDDKPLDFAYSGAEFWPVLDDLCLRTGNKLRPHYDTREPGLVITAGRPGAYPVAYAGPIRAQITSARRAFSEEIDYETVRSDKSHTFQINLQMMWEDRFKLIAYRAQPELVLARTNHGTDVASTQPQAAGWNVAGNGTRQLTMNLRLHPPATAATKLETLSIKWGLIAAGDITALRVDDLESRSPFYQDDVELRIESLEIDPSRRVELTLVVVRDLVLDDPQEAFFQECEVDLFDQADTAYRKQGQTNSHESDGARMKLTFVAENGESKPKYLKFTYPRIRAQKDVVITFKDVPLPSSRPE